MKVLFFLSSHSIGLSSLLTEQAVFLNKLETLDLNFIAGEKEQESGLTDYLDSHHIICKRIFGLDDHRDFFRLVKDFKVHVKIVQPDVVHVQTNWQLVIVSIVKLFVKKKFKILYTIHGYRNNKKIKSVIALSVIQLLLLFLSDKVFAASTIVYEKFYLIKKKLNILFLGVEENFFKFEHSCCEDIENIKIIFPAVFREGKNQSSLIKIVKQYIEKTGDKSIELHLPGDGPLRSECINLASSLGVEKNVKFPGYISHAGIVNYYRTCNVAIIPSSSETFGHCIAEPYVLGLCVISRQTGIAVDIIQDGHNGYIYNSDEELLNLLVKLNKNSLLIANCGRASFSDRNSFRWRKITKQYEKYVLGLKN